MNWIILNQLGRRNLSPDAASMLRYRLHQSRKKEVGAPDGNENAKKQPSQSETVDSRPEDTATQVARETGVSRATVFRDVLFGKASDKLGISGDVIAGKVDAPRATIIEVVA